MKSRRTLTIVAFALLALGCSDNRASDSQVVGTTASVLGEAISSRMGARSRFAFVTDTSERLDVLADDFHFSGDYLSASGTVSGPDSSSFILKGDRREIYGWLVLHDRNIAYEYTTSSDGRVVVEKVPVTKIFPVCDSDIETLDDADADRPEPSTLALVAGPPHVGEYDGASDTNKLQSKPGAGKVLFMDVAPLPLAKAQIWRGWQIVAASFSAFDVNVTTDAAIYNATPMQSRGKACSRPESGRSSCGLNAFGTTRCCNVYNKGNGYYQGTTTAHELGHLMGLRHDGTTGGSAYFSGLNTFRWCPIMGANTPKTRWGAQALFQWSKGEYATANNKEDDLQIISRNLPFRPDDIPASKPLIINSGSQVSASDNFGQIAQNTDSDSFTFGVGNGGARAALTVDRIEDIGGGYLDVDAEIQNAAGMVLAKGNDMYARTAKLDVMLPAGEYRLIVKGGGEGTPMAGFSNYSSLGYYGISGTISGDFTPGTDAGTGGGVDMSAPGRPDGAIATDARAGDAASGEPPTTTADAGAPGGGTGGSGGSGTGGDTGGRSGGGGAGPANGGRSGGAGSGGSAGPVSEPGTTRGVSGGFGCSVADPSAEASGSAAGLLVMLATALVGRRRPRRR